MVVMAQNAKTHTTDIPEDGHEITRSKPGFVLIKRQIGSLLVLAFSMIVAVGSLGLPIGTLGNPSPGFWPLVVGCLTAVFAIIEFFVGKDETEGFTGRGVRRTLIMVCTLLLVPIGYQFVGFLVPTFMMILIMMVALSRQKLGLSLLVGAIVSTTGYYVFAELLQVRLSAF